MLDLSIVIVNYRSWLKLDSCLLSIKQQKQKVKQVIIVDNFSNDGILESFIKKFAWVKWIKNESNTGFAAACNLGAQNCSSHWILFINPDTILPINCLGTLIPFCDQHPEFHLITIKQISESGKNTYPHGVFPNILNSLGLIRYIHRLIYQPDQSKKVISISPISFPNWISGSFVLLRRKHFDLIGGWDDQFWMYCEDIDLCKRAEKKGLSRVLLNKWECFHFHGVSSRANKETKVITKAEVIKSTHIYIEKHFKEEHITIH